MEIKSHDREADGKLHYTENFPLVQPQRCSSHGEVADAPKKVQSTLKVQYVRISIARLSGSD